MLELIYLLIAIPYLTSGRRLYALRQCLEVAETIGHATLLSLIQAAIAHDSKTIIMERAWIRSKKVSTARGDAANLDNQIDSVLGDILTVLNSNIRGLKKSHPASLASKTIIAKVFPNGVHPIITLPFEEQLMVNETVIAMLKGELKTEAALAGIEGFVEHLEELNDAFSDELENFETKEIDFSVLEAARDKGNLNLRTIVAVTLVEYREATGEKAQEGHKLLKPIFDQGDRLRQARKGRRPIQDVDPDTGEELPDEEIAA